MRVTATSDRLRKQATKLSSLASEAGKFLLSVLGGAQCDALG